MHEKGEDASAGTRVRGSRCEDERRKAVGRGCDGDSGGPRGGLPTPPRRSLSRKPPASCRVPEKCTPLTACESRMRGCGKFRKGKRPGRRLGSEPSRARTTFQGLDPTRGRVHFSGTLRFWAIFVAAGCISRGLCTRLCTCGRFGASTWPQRTQAMALPAPAQRKGPLPRPFRSADCRLV